MNILEPLMQMPYLHKVGAIVFLLIGQVTLLHVGLERFGLHALVIAFWFFITIGVVLGQQLIVHPDLVGETSALKAIFPGLIVFGIVAAAIALGVTQNVLLVTAGGEAPNTAFPFILGTAGPILAAVVIGVIMKAETDWRLLLYIVGLMFFAYLVLSRLRELH